MSFCLQGNFWHRDLDIHDFARDALHVMIGKGWLGVGLHTVVGLVGGLVTVGLVWSDFGWVWTLKLKQL